MAVAVAIPVPVARREAIELGRDPVTGQPRDIRMPRPADLEQLIEQLEGLLAATAGEAGAGRVGARALLQPEGGPEADRPGDQDSHPEAGCGPAEGTAVEPGAGPGETAVAANPADPAVAAGTDHALGVGKEALAIRIGGAVVPAAQEGADHLVDAAGPVREVLAPDHRRELHDADSLNRRAVRA